MESSAAPLVSGEGVRLELLSAGVGSRVLAALLDAAIELAALGLLYLLNLSLVDGSDTAAVTAVLIVEFVLVLAGYPIVMEWLTRGRTVGKLAFGLRVVRVDGGPIGFRQALVRGIAGLVLEKPGLVFPITTIAGLLVMSVSRREQRIGDLLAGTIVLTARPGVAVSAPLPPWPPAYLQPWAYTLDLTRLDEGLTLAARQFVGRAHAMDAAARTDLEAQLRDRVLAVIAPPPPPQATTPEILMTVLIERRRRAFAPPGPVVPPVPPVFTKTSAPGRAMPRSGADDSNDGPFTRPD